MSTVHMFFRLAPTIAHFILVIEVALFIRCFLLTKFQTFVFRFAV